MNTADFLIARFNNFKGNLFISGKKNKVNSLKINIIINNTAKAREDDNFNFLNNKNNFKRRNKRGKRFYNKKLINIRNYGSPNQINIIKKKNFEFQLFQLLM